MVYLQHRVHELEQELERVESEDVAEDPESMMRAVNVRVHEAKDSKFLGPSSGIAMTRLVMQLAKQFTDAKSIKDVVTPQSAVLSKKLYAQEQAKPTSKVYPLISNVAAVDLPSPRALVEGLVQLYKAKVQPMYPVLHEPSLDRDMDALYALGKDASPYQHFIGRMVIAISLQKMDTQYAGLADSYYLAALQYLEPVVEPMDLHTLQCLALMAEYSLLTPTRTAIYYVVGIAVRLAQALGLNEEKSIVRPNADGKTDPLEIDMRRRLFWCIVVMDFGLAHSLGRPAMLATGEEHVDVGWFETCDDKFITSDGIDPTAPRPSLKKWIAIHFFKMRILQLEIRRKLYLKKRPSPKSDKDPWFVQMDAKLTAWRDASPSADQTFGTDKIWFIGRYNTMVVFLYRPSPQVPRPSLDAALKCFDACEYNIYMQSEQIDQKNVDLTWVFTQSIFMAVNTMLWALSYDEVRRRHSRESVERHLTVAMDAIQLASERWPGVESAAYLYRNLISAILQIYEKDGDVNISAATPSDAASPPASTDISNRSRATSPGTLSSSSVATPSESRYSQMQSHRHNVEQPPPIPYQSDFTQPYTPPPAAASSSTIVTTPPSHSSSFVPSHSSPPAMPQFHNPHPRYFDPYQQFNSLPQFEPGITVPGWSAPIPDRIPFNPTAGAASYLQNTFDYFATNGGGVGGDQSTMQTNYANHAIFDPSNPAYPFPGVAEQNQFINGNNIQQDWDMDGGAFGIGLNQSQQEELMQSLELHGMDDIQSMLAATRAASGGMKPS